MVSRFAILIALAGVLAAPLTLARADDAALAVHGKAVVDKHCSRCHQTGRTGTSRLPDAPPFRELMTRYAPETLEEALGEGLSSGHPAMPEFVFEPDEIAAIVAYFATLKPR